MEKVFVEQEAKFEQLRIDLQAKNSSILEKTEAKFIAKVDTLLEVGVPYTSKGICPIYR